MDQAFECAKGLTKDGGLLVADRGLPVYEEYSDSGHSDAAPNGAFRGIALIRIAAGILPGERPDLVPKGLDQKFFTNCHLPGVRGNVVRPWL